MAISNVTSSYLSTFILFPIPEMEVVHGWMSLPFCSIYILSLLANGIVLTIIKMEPSLHKPMYLFLSMLLVKHLIVSNTILPKALCVFWFKDQDIHTGACLVQLYLVHSLTIIDSGLLVAMAFDRYVAICNPLRHSAILNSRVIAKVGLGVVLRGFVLMAPYPFLLNSLSYCETVISHTFCEFVALIKVSCADPSVKRVYSPSLIIFTAMVDSFLVTLSYILILRAVFKLPSKEARLTSLSTCGPHFCIIFVTYSSGFIAFFTYLYSDGIPPYFHVILSNFYLLTPAVLDPIIYGVKTKKIWESVLKVFSVKGFHALF